MLTMALLCQMRIKRYRKVFNDTNDGFLPNMHPKNSLVLSAHSKGDATSKPWVGFRTWLDNFSVNGRRKTQQLHSMLSLLIVEQLFVAKASVHKLEHVRASFHVVIILCVRFLDSFRCFPVLSPLIHVMSLS